MEDTPAIARATGENVSLQLKMPYQILETETVNDLQNRVSAYQQMGWHCVGGPFAVRGSISGPIKFYQAVENSNGAETKPNWKVWHGDISRQKKRGRPRKEGES